MNLLSRLLAVAFAERSCDVSAESWCLVEGNRQNFISNPPQGRMLSFWDFETKVAQDKSDSANHFTDTHCVSPGVGGGHGIILGCGGRRLKSVKPITLRGEAEVMFWYFPFYKGTKKDVIILSIGSVYILHLIGGEIGVKTNQEKVFRKEGYTIQPEAWIHIRIGFHDFDRCSLTIELGNAETQIFETDCGPRSGILELGDLEGSTAFLDELFVSSD